MYTLAMTETPLPNTSPVETLAVFLRRWRGPRGVREIAAKAGLNHSIWSKLENGRISPSIETLLRLSEHTGKSIEELALMAGLSVRRSLNGRDRADRVATMALAVPRAGVLVDLLSELAPDEIDVLLTVAEGMIHHRRGGRK